MLTSFRNAEIYRTEIMTPYDVLREFSGNRISLNTRTIWAPRSCNFIPYDFFL